MPLDLPKPIAEYFAADHTRDAHALARCFAADGVVHDEGGTFRGTEAIRDWSAATREKYHHTVEPLSSTIQQLELRPRSAVSRRDSATRN